MDGGSTMKSFVLLVVFLFAAVPAALAEKRVALVIGNNAYEEVPKLQKAVEDARSVSAALTRLGFDVDTGEDLTRRQLNTKFSNFIKRIEPGDTAFFFFSGHGVVIGGQNILLPVDIVAPDNEDLVRDEGHVVDDLLQRVKDKGARVSMFVLDACRNNPFAASGRKSIGGTRGLRVVDPPSGTFVLMAAGSGQEALDRLSDSDTNPNSVFTRALLPLLETPGMTHVELAKSVQQTVKETAKSIGHDQQPAFYDQITGLVTLSGDIATPEQAKADGATQDPVVTDTNAAAAAGDMALTEWNAVKDVRSIGTLKKFAGKYPSSAYADYARALIADLEAAALKEEEAKRTLELQKRQEEEKTKQEQETAALQKGVSGEGADEEPAIKERSTTVTRVRAGWFVIMGSYPHADIGRAKQRAKRLKGSGYEIKIIDTDDYNTLTNGYYSVVMGPFRRAQALSQLNDMQQHVGDAYIKEVR